MIYRKFQFIIWLAAGVLLAGCAGTPHKPAETSRVPGLVLAVDPHTECSEYANPGGWDMQAMVVETGGRSYLVVYFDPGYTLDREPQVNLKTSYAILLEQRGNYYYYDLGKISNSKRLGKISFRSRVPVRYNASMTDKIEVFSMERWEKSDCVKLID